MVKRSLILALLSAVALPALGYIEAMNSLKGVYQESDVIARAPSGISSGRRAMTQPA